MPGHGTCIVFLSLIGSVWLQSANVVSDSGEEETARFGLSLLDPIRQWYCRNFCTSPQEMPYIANLACAIKCPESYLPESSTTEQASTSASTATPTTAGTTASTESTATASTAATTANTTPGSSSTTSSAESTSSATTAASMPANATTSMPANATSSMASAPP